MNKIIVEEAKKKKAKFEENASNSSFVRATEIALSKINIMAIVGAILLFSRRKTDKPMYTMNIRGTRIIVCTLKPITSITNFNIYHLARKDTF